MILGFSIFPLLVSAWMAVSRFKLIGGGYQFRFVGWLNFKKLFVGSEQFHLLGTFAAIPVIGWIILLAVAALVGLGVYRYAKDSPITVLGIVGRAISFGLVLFLAWLIVSTIGTGGQMGSLSTTIFYVTLGVLIQFVIGTGLAWLCSQNITARSFFRLVFFIPLMVTPVGIAYTFRMMVDMNVGPISPIWQALGLGQFSWSSNPWSARMVVIVGDSWQWIPFIFLVMLAAFESQPKDELEAASIDGASGLQIFRDITWPSVAPVAATVVLIRVIEAFKIIDLPNILTNGGPGIASESLTLHSFIQWRSLDLGASSAVAYVLLFVSTVICVSFFNFVVSPARRTSR
ncbi:carbohydrate ABC transporter permease [Rhizobium sp. LjRoot254]|uniref:carbohydrate ABC transporter permease n=1 Tax=Rhizobium sp. LjRoot254 TaxID=3342297 RepID=UPI003ECC220E